jgi:hypothetical protein
VSEDQAIEVIGWYWCSCCDIDSLRRAIATSKTSILPLDVPTAKNDAQGLHLIVVAYEVNESSDSSILERLSAGTRVVAEPFNETFRIQMSPRLEPTASSPVLETSMHVM